MKEKYIIRHFNKPNAYIEQLQRVRRFLDRIERTDLVQADYEDYLWSFFQNCWHLKDWIKNDDSLPQSVRSKTIKSEALLHCADLANRSKHSTLIRYIQRNADVEGVDATVFVGSKNEFKYRISSDSAQYWDAVELARQAVKEWEEYLIQNKLPIE